MASLATTLSLIIFTRMSSAAALPSPHSLHTLAKRTPSAHRIGSGFGIAIAIVVFGAIVFYLGVRRGRTGSWHCWRDPPDPSVTDNEKCELPRTRILRTSIGFPKLERTTVPIELSPVEAKPKWLELPANDKIAIEIGEKSPAMIGEKSPQPHPPSHTHQQNNANIRRERNSWFSRGRRSLTARSWGARSGKKSLYEMDGESMPPPPKYPEPVRLREGSEGGGAMDWEGLEWLRKMYEGRKSIYKPAS